ncbi:bifunctional 4-hydroxy-2-oxoglutarate aldolase/2-dehydro-3-deoxy-phosphogluconate aldolase [Granulosicoccus antarcticus]|uniref:2-dehydro-3-deoxy-phosphogluconate aldolase n=1 Tax=Granulosicoccus antarcticus IMCC3135 TaxID=1192854 RepID=A0A2Z2P0H4_9GAMM|nr:bifunctional 4-hydroxy-2-oxoglutarate aldolase/2-dehydro-3-deoxy-phosphogluconate aldolase [Granulosicoccus antarcticus]ASJ72954.1 KHG/KDPG aldolase [Granulosicoccus antarcticus IMCC3135]
MKVRELMQVAPVIPVLVIDDVSKAKPLAEALVAGGLRVLEVTLRTPVALEAMKAMADVPGAIVGVGTALNGDDLKRAQDHGATFAVSPGFTIELGAAANAMNMPLLPGIMTPADIMRALDGGFDALKFFPASHAGGAPFLKALTGPFGEVKFCPTGGITADTAKDYLSIPNVLCVGGSWVAPAAMVNAGDWEGITKLAKACDSLR